MLNMSSQLMWDEAVKRGVSCARVGHTQAIKMTRDDQSWFVSGSRTSFQSSIGFRAAQHKSLTKAFLVAAQAPTAHSVEIETAADLPKANQLHFPVVMKPLGGAHGAGVVVNLADANQLQQAFAADPQPMIVEEMLQGIEYRVLCVDYQLAAVSYRRPALVIGDGQHTISELIDRKNADPRRGSGHTHPLTKIIIDQEVHTLLAKQNLQLDTVAATKQEVLLRAVANLSQGGEAINVTAEVSAANKQLFEDIARAMDLNVCGIDIMCRNLHDPIIKQSHAGVIEVNGSPGLRMHHFPSVGEPINVASLIFDLIERELAQRKTCS